MPTKHSPTEADRGFDAVAESRRWKESVAEKTAGMTIPERIAWFRRQSSVTEIRDRAGEAAKGMTVREDPADYDTDRP
jgi:hypothetical protein